jgi:hypothetical protein
MTNPKPGEKKIKKPDKKHELGAAELNKKLGPVVKKHKK